MKSILLPAAGLGGISRLGAARASGCGGAAGPGAEAAQQGRRLRHRHRLWRALQLFSWLKQEDGLPAGDNQNNTGREYPAAEVQQEPQCLSERRHSEGKRALPLADPQGNTAMLQPKKPPSVKGFHSLYRFCNAFQNRSAPFLTECTSHKTDICTGCIDFYEGCLPSLFAEPA